MSVPVILIVLDRLLVVQASKPWRDGVLLGLLGLANCSPGKRSSPWRRSRPPSPWQCCARRPIGRYRPISLMRGEAWGWPPFVVASFPLRSWLSSSWADRVQDVHPSYVFVSDLENFLSPPTSRSWRPGRLARRRPLHRERLRAGRYWDPAGPVHRPHPGPGPPPPGDLGRPDRRSQRRHSVPGSTLHWDGAITGAKLPFYYFQSLPFFHNLLADRFASMMWVGVGLLVALGCNELRHLPRTTRALAGLAGLGLAAIFPITDYPAAASPQYLAFDTGMSCPRAAPGSSGTPRWRWSFRPSTRWTCAGRRRRSSAS